jgi:carbonic anhydrase
LQLILLRVPERGAHQHFVDALAQLLASSLKTAHHNGTHWHDTGPVPGSHQADFVDWLTIRDQAESVVTDVERIRTHPLVPGDIPIYGYIYQVETGQLIEVPEATCIGRAR